MMRTNNSPTLPSELLVGGSSSSCGVAARLMRRTLAVQSLPAKWRTTHADQSVQWQVDAVSFHFGVTCAHTDRQQSVQNTSSPLKTTAPQSAASLAAAHLMAGPSLVASVAALLRLASPGCRLRSVVMTARPVLEACNE
jgi:hypothetical protein